MKDKNGGWESFKVESATVLDKVKALIREGNVRRVVVEHQGRTIAVFPLTVGVVGAVLAPVAAAIAAVVALFKDCTIHVERASSDTTPDRERTSQPSTIAALVLAAALGAGIPAQAWPANQHDHATAATAPKDDAASAATTPDMTAMRQAMMSDSKAADARLQVLVETMNGSTGEARIDAMAAVIAELVAERAAMRVHMGSMSQMMKPDPTGTATEGAPADMCKMAEPCEMMKNMAAPAQKP